MDARTFQPKNQIPSSFHMNLLVGIFHNLAAAISYDSKQKWYYYSRQSTTEVLVFHQYSKVSSNNQVDLQHNLVKFQGKWFANPHTSFLNRNCPKGTEEDERISAESRVALFF